MSSPTDRKYTESHEWLKVDGDTVTLGLTRFAVDQLTDVTFVEMQPAGTEFAEGDSLGEVESVKTTSDVYGPGDGEIVETNDAVADDPSILNDDPYEKGWLVKLKLGDASVVEGLMDAATYDEKYAS